MRAKGDPAKVEWVMKIDIAAYDWNCSQHITPRYTQQEIQAAFEAQRQGTPQPEPQ